MPPSKPTDGLLRYGGTGHISSHRTMLLPSCKVPSSSSQAGLEVDQIYGEWEQDFSEQVARFSLTSLPASPELSPLAQVGRILPERPPQH